MPNVEINGLDIYYEVHGSGLPLMLIPGFASGIWSWKYQVTQLLEQFQVITFDPRGISRSQIGEETPISIAIIADDIAALMDELRLDRASILGISFGGFVAQDFALRYSDRVRKLVLACTSFGGKNHVLPSIEILAAFASTKALNSRDRIRQYLTMAFSSDFVTSAAGTVDDFCRLREQNNVPEGVYLSQLASATAFDVSDRVAGISCDTLILTGDRDTVVPMQNSVNLAAAIPNSTLEIVAGGSHMFFVEKDKEFNRIVSEFVRR